VERPRSPPDSQMASEAQQAIRRVTKCGDDYYAILGVDKGAGDDEIKKAYRKLALRLHPDKCKESGAEEAFKRVGEAFSVLSDADKRQRYDQFGVEGIQGGGGGGPNINPEDIFQAFFGGAGGFPGGTTFVQRGGPGGFQTFTFSSSGPGGVHFQMGSPFGGGGSPFGGMGGHPGVRQRRRQAEQEEEEQAATPDWLKKVQVFMQMFGPLLPLVIMALLALAMLLMGTIIQFFMQRAFIILPILYLTEGKTKGILLMTIVLLAMFGVI